MKFDWKFSRWNLNQNFDSMNEFTRILFKCVACACAFDFCWYLHIKWTSSERSTRNEEARKEWTYKYIYETTTGETNINKNMNIDVRSVFLCNIKRSSDAFKWFSTCWYYSVDCVLLQGEEPECWVSCTIILEWKVER